MQIRVFRTKLVSGNITKNVCINLRSYLGRYSFIGKNGGKSDITTLWPFELPVKQSTQFGPKVSTRAEFVVLAGLYLKSLS